MIRLPAGAAADYRPPGPWAPPLLATRSQGARKPDSRYREAVPNAAPSRRPRLFTAGLALFALGLLGILAVFLARPVADVNPPLALYLLGMLLPVGLFLAVFSAFRNGRRVP